MPPEADDQLIDAYRTFGKVLFQQRRHREAITAYEKSLQLALRGCKPLSGPILTHDEEQRLLDPDHFQIHAILGRLYALQNETNTAIIEYRMAIAGKFDGFFIRNRLARLYHGQGQRRQAVREIWAGVKMIPGDLRQARRLSWRRLRRVVKDKYRTLRAH